MADAVIEAHQGEDFAPVAEAEELEEPAKAESIEEITASEEA